jgi:sugar O-acyltransferase (sialic acid O-acetyltransferase NeuD family)
MNVYIIGSGGNSKIVSDICELNGYIIAGFFDDKFPIVTQHYHHQIIGNIDDISKYPGINVVNSIGDCETRYNINTKLADLALNWINCIHPSAIIAANTHIGRGNIICAGAVINSDANIGNFNLINTYAVIEHDCQIGNYNHFAPKTTLCGGIKIGDVNFFGVGSSVIPNKNVGNGNIIGAMTLIINNITDDNKVVGVPGRTILR